MGLGLPACKPFPRPADPDFSCYTTETGPVWPETAADTFHVNRIAVWLRTPFGAHRRLPSNQGICRISIYRHFCILGSSSGDRSLVGSVLSPAVGDISGGERGGLVASCITFLLNAVNVLKYVHESTEHSIWVGQES
ncbi:hypothetical protein KCU81_g235, partial [Aureobasidium melanogenum]